MTDTCDSASTCLLEEYKLEPGDQRRSTRFRPEQSDCFVVVEHQRLTAEIVDESFDGVGVLVARPFSGDVNDPIELLYCGLPLRGVIRSITPQGRRTRLSIQWAQLQRTTVDDRRPRCRTESDYLLLAGLPVACRVVDQADNRLIAMLPDGTELEVAPDDIRPIGRIQRLADLDGAADELRLLAAIYQLGAFQSIDDALREVLNLEFAPSWK